MKKTASKRSPANGFVGPRLNPDHPVKAFIDPNTGARFTAITVPTEDGRFAAVVESDQNIRATGRTRAEAERKICQAAVKRRINPAADAADLKMARQRLKAGGFLSHEEFMKRYGG